LTQYGHSCFSHNPKLLSSSSSLQSTVIEAKTPPKGKKILQRGEEKKASQSRSKQSKPKIPTTHSLEASRNCALP